MGSLSGRNTDIAPSVGYHKLTQEQEIVYHHNTLSLKIGEEAEFLNTSVLVGLFMLVAKSALPWIRSFPPEPDYAKIEKFFLVFFPEIDFLIEWDIRILFGWLDGARRYRDDEKFLAVVKNILGREE